MRSWPSAPSPTWPRPIRRSWNGLGPTDADSSRSETSSTPPKGDPPRGPGHTAGFFDQLDAQLPAERGPQGEPSVTDFIAVVLPTVIDRFADQFDDLPELVTGVAATRMFIGPGVLVPPLPSTGYSATTT
jgi:hypothetical protein